MTYSFKCSNELCDCVCDIEKPMNDPFPIVHCCNCGIEMIRDYRAESETRGTIIPEHMRASSTMKSDFKYDSSPSGKKHIYGGYTKENK